MCGISGIYTFDDTINNRINIQKMVTVLEHRGPDSNNIWYSRNEKCHLGHTRLSIIDLSSLASQPMHNSNNTLHITFNGEIYNYLKLREELIDKGYRFKSNSDTEVLLYSYEEYGVHCLSKIDGMFAFAIYDEIKEELFLARDRFGKKPLYYTFTDGKFIFSSEIKAIFEVEDIKKEINKDVLGLYLNFLTTPSPNSLFKDVFKLQNSHYLMVNKSGKIDENTYYRISDLFNKKDFDLSEKEIEDELLRLLNKSISKRMMSDVPHGVFLSGGVDSSANVAMMSQISKDSVNTFNISIKNDRTSNEVNYARQVSKLFNTNHYETTIDQNDFIELFDTIGYIQDEPLADPVCIPLYYISKLAREKGVYVIPLGEGSDEIFAG